MRIKKQEEIKKLVCEEFERLVYGELKELVYEELEKWGFKKERRYNKVEGYLWPSEVYFIESVKKLQKKLDKLIEHFGLEFFTKEIKESNGEEKHSYTEGYRKRRVKKKSVK